ARESCVAQEPWEARDRWEARSLPNLPQPTPTYLQSTNNLQTTPALCQSPNRSIVKRATAIHRQYLPGNIGRLGHQERQCAGDVAGLAAALQGDFFQNSRFGVGIQLALVLGPENGAGGDAIDAHMGRQLARQRLGEHDI